MGNTRRSFLGALLVPFVARFMPKKSPATVLDGFVESLNDGVAPSWDQVSRMYQSSAGMPDLMLCSRPMFEYVSARIAMDGDPETKWFNHQFAKPSGGKWIRIANRMEYPQKAPQLPA